MGETNLKAWDQSLSIFGNKSEAKLVNVSLPHVPYTMSVYSILTSCEVASNFSRYDGLRYGYHKQLGKSDYHLESILKQNRDESLGNIVKSRIVSGNYFLMKEYLIGHFNFFLKQILLTNM